MTKDEARETAIREIISTVPIAEAGFKQGARLGFDAGYEAGKAAGIAQGTLDGYDAGFKAGHETKHGELSITIAAPTETDASEL